MAEENKFDKFYSFRIATVNDIEMIMNFIDIHWKKDHILAKDRELFEYQHVYGDKVTFLLAFSKETNELEAILGYILTSSSIEKKDVWTAIWKVREDHNNVPMLEIELIKRLEKMEECRNVILVGANPETSVPIMKIMMRYNTARMKHYYRLGNYEEFKIALNVNTKTTNDEYPSIKWKQLDENDFISSFCELKNMDEIQDIPYKDQEYYVKRYYHHPYYSYQIFKIETKNDFCILILKEVEIEDRIISRVVDYVGNQNCFSECGLFFTDILKEKKYEYIDFYSLNFDEKYICDAGFVERMENDEVIIPNYMEPFLQENIEIYTCYKNDKCLIFKGDADQDRPNIIKNI